LNNDVFIRGVKAAAYELNLGKNNVQPLIVDVEHLSGKPRLEVQLDGASIYQTTLDSARYQLEVPMPAVTRAQRSTYRILANGKEIETGTVQRAPGKRQTPADYVDTRIGTAHSRWMIAPGPWMPFSMVKLSPDNQNMGWQAGYQPTFETIGTFSHIHEWTMAGLGMMPTNGKLQTQVGDQFNPDAGYRARIDKSTEEAPLGYYKVYMPDERIWAEVTATERAGFHRYTFPRDQAGRVMIDLHVQGEYDYKLLDVEIRKVSDYRIEGSSHQISPRPTVWSNDADQEYTVHFVIEFDQPIKKAGGWLDTARVDIDKLRSSNLREAGAWVEFDTRSQAVVQARSGISLVSVANAGENLDKEISKPFGWRYDAVVAHQKNVWNNYLSRITVSSDDRLEKVRFYTNFFRSLCRNTWSDVNGE